LSHNLHINFYKYAIETKHFFTAKDLSLAKGEKVLLKGPSGIGKSLFGLGLIHMFPRSAKVELDMELFTEGNLVSNDNIAWDNIRADHIAFVFQQPLAYLNPVLTCGEQLIESMPDSDYSLRHEKAIAICKQLKIKQYGSIFAYYPHQFSIGELQRFLIAAAILRNPQIIIADEPFANLDTPVSQICKEVLDQYIAENNASLLLISHDDSINKNWIHHCWRFTAERTIVEDVLATDSIRVHSFSRKRNSDSQPECLIEAKDIVKSFDQSSYVALRAKRSKILDCISFSIDRGERIGIMGDSGSGKTTIALLLSGLISPDSGYIKGLDTDHFNLSGFMKREPAPVQLVFQDPFSSLNPSVIIRKQLPKRFNTKNGLSHLLRRMNLDEALMDRIPGELSGGELQRFCILKALYVSPSTELLIFDEALSALDEENRVAVIHLINELYPEMSIFYISHRYEHIKSMCNSVLFLRNSKIEAKLTLVEIERPNTPAWIKSICGL
jgi:microcin C transport system ATP-binding protein